MKNRLLLGLVIILTVLTLSLTLLTRQSPAQSANFTHVFPFSTVGGYVGFFDQNDGKIYLYDEFLKECMYISQLEELGNPMTTLK